jgi:hypothetical protein
MRMGEGRSGPDDSDPGVSSRSGDMAGGGEPSRRVVATRCQVVRCSVQLTRNQMVQPVSDAWGSTQPIRDGAYPTMG